MDRIATLVEDLQTILAYPEPDEVEDFEPTEITVSPSVEEASAKKDSGDDLERKARAKRVARKAKVSGGHNPFKTKTKLGPGPLKGRNSQTKKWKCTCASPYVCACKNKDGTRKRIRIKKAYKSRYNKIFKRWRKNQKQ